MRGLLISLLGVTVTYSLLLQPSSGFAWTTFKPLLEQGDENFNRSRLMSTTWLGMCLILGHAFKGVNITSLTVAGQPTLYTKLEELLLDKFTIYSKVVKSTEVLRLNANAYNET